MKEFALKTRDGGIVMKIQILSRKMIFDHRTTLYILFKGRGRNHDSLHEQHKVIHFLILNDI